MLLKAVTVSPSPTPASAVSSLTSLPKFEAFNKSKEKFPQYVERLEQHFTLHNAKDPDAKRACLLASVGCETYHLLKNLYSNSDLSIQSYSDLVKKLTNHFAEIVNKYAARFEFSPADLKPDQTYADWVATLRGLSADCDFNCPNAGCGASFTDQMIIDVMIRRTPHAEVRRKCLEDKSLTVEKLVDKAQSYLQTCKSEQVVQGSEKLRSENAVNKLTSAYNKPKKSRRPEFRKQDSPKQKQGHQQYSIRIGSKGVQDASCITRKRTALRRTKDVITAAGKIILPLCVSQNNRRQ